MTDESLLMKTLEILRDVRATVHDDVDTGVVRQLDEAIRILEEEAQKTRPDLSPGEVLMLLGKAIEVLPAVAQLLEQLRDCR